MKMNMKWNVFGALVLGITMYATCCEAIAAPFTQGNLVVEQIGLTGSSTALSSKGTAVVLREFTQSGSAVQTLALPTTPSGTNNPLTLSGTAGSEGELSRSADRRYLVVAGYDVGIGSSTQTTSTIGLIGAAGTIDTSTTTSLLSGNNTRGATSVDGSNIWVTGPKGVVELAADTSGGTNIASSLNFRQLEVVPASSSPTGVMQLLGSSNKAGGPDPGVATFSPALPTSSASAALLSGMSSTTSPNSFGFYFANPTTLFVADGTLGIQEWIKSGSTWSNAATLSGSFVGITGFQSGNTVTLFATTGTSSGWSANNSLISDKFTFNSGATGAGTFGAPTTLATASGNSGFAGVAFAPVASVPEPSTWMLLAIGAAGIGLAARRRKKTA